VVKGKDLTKVKSKSAPSRNSTCIRIGLKKHLQCLIYSLRMKEDVT
ncbi:unnamed protein product, partial [Allacma fusca]